MPIETSRKLNIQRTIIDDVPSICFESLFQLPDWLIYFKDAKGKYIRCNDAAIGFLQIPREELINKYDRELPWKDCAIQWRNNELKVIAEKTAQQLFESLIYKGKKYTYLSMKMPVHRGNKTSGTLALLKQLQQIDLDEEANLPKISKRQCECLYYLTKGFVPKQIASIMKLSIRTIENYIENLKIKLDCYHRHDLIAKAHQLPWIKDKLFMDSFGRD